MGYTACKWLSTNLLAMLQCYKRGGAQQRGRNAFPEQQRMDEATCHAGGQAFPLLIINFPGNLPSSKGVGRLRHTPAGIDTYKS